MDPDSAARFREQEARIYRAVKSAGHTCVVCDSPYALPNQSREWICTGCHRERFENS